MSSASNYREELVTGPGGLLSRGLLEKQATKYGALPPTKRDRSTLAAMLSSYVETHFPDYAKLYSGAGAVAVLWLDYRLESREADDVAMAVSLVSDMGGPRLRPKIFLHSIHLNQHMVVAEQIASDEIKNFGLRTHICVLDLDLVSCLRTVRERVNVERTRRVRLEDNLTWICP